MKAAVPEDLLKLLGIQISPGTVAAASLVLETTLPSLEALLESELAAKDREDSFSLGIRDTTPTLRLHSGFLDLTTPPSVTNVGVVVDPSDYQVDPERGLIFLKTVVATGARSIAVSYSTGFPDSTELPGVFSGLPDGVTQAALSLGAAYYLLNPNNAPKQKAAHLSSIAIAGFESAARRAVEVFQRPRATAIWPDYSVVV